MSFGKMISCVSGSGIYSVQLYPVNLRSGIAKIITYKVCSDNTYFKVICILLLYLEYFYIFDFFLCSTEKFGCSFDKIVGIVYSCRLVGRMHGKLRQPDIDCVDCNLGVRYISES